MRFHAKLKLRKAGGSLIVTIPKRLATQAGLQAGDEVAVTLESHRVVLDEFIGSIPELSGYQFDRRELWGPDRY